MTQQQPCLVHLVGSMALPSAEEVVRTTAAILGKRIKRLSNGEVGITRNWIIGHHRIFERHPAFEEYVHVENNDPRAPGQRRRRFRLRAGAAPLTMESFGPLGYVEDAQETYGFLKELRQDGTVAPSTRLLLAVPTPYDILNFAVDRRDFPAVFPVYEKYLLESIRQVAVVIPNDELAIQWDAAHEFEYLATGSPMFNPMTREEMVAMLVRLGDGVPPAAELGYHCCYGNFNLKHFVEPIDMSDMVDVMNRVMAGLGRKVQFIHMPVPIDRTDEAYFAPLRNLRLGPDTEFYLGLAHDGDGVPGTLHRAKVAKKFVPDFGISTECGLAMRTPENIRELLRIQADAAAAIDRGEAA